MSETLSATEQHRAVRRENSESRRKLEDLQAIISAAGGEVTVEVMEAMQGMVEHRRIVTDTHREMQRLAPLVEAEDAAIVAHASRKWRPLHRAALVKMRAAMAAYEAARRELVQVEHEATQERASLDGTWIPDLGHAMPNLDVVLERTKGWAK